MITHLVDTGRADPARIVLAGGSRGAFLALHCAKLDERVGAVVANMPATELGILREPSLLTDGSLASRLDLGNVDHNLFGGKRILVTIGAQDSRVGTDLAIDFSRRASTAGALVDLHVLYRGDEGGENGHAGSIPQSVELAESFLGGVL